MFTVDHPILQRRGGGLKEPVEMLWTWKLICQLSLPGFPKTIIFNIKSHVAASFYRH